MPLCQRRFVNRAVFEIPPANRALGARIEKSTARLQIRRPFVCGEKIGITWPQKRSPEPDQKYLRGREPQPRPESTLEAAGRPPLRPDLNTGHQKRSVSAYDRQLAHTSEGRDFNQCQTWCFQVHVSGLRFQNGSFYRHTHAWRVHSFSPHSIVSLWSGLAIFIFASAMSKQHGGEEGWIHGDWARFVFIGRSFRWLIDGEGFFFLSAVVRFRRQGFRYFGSGDVMNILWCSILILFM